MLNLTIKLYIDLLLAKVSQIKQGECLWVQKGLHNKSQKRVATRFYILKFHFRCIIFLQFTSILTWIKSCFDIKPNHLWLVLAQFCKFKQLYLILKHHFGGTKWV